MVNLKVSAVVLRDADGASGFEIAEQRLLEFPGESLSSSESVSFPVRPLSEFIGSDSLASGVFDFGGFQRNAGFSDVPRGTRRVVVSIPFLKVFGRHETVFDYVLDYHLAALSGNGVKRLEDGRGDGFSGHIISFNESR